MTTDPTAAASALASRIIAEVYRGLVRQGLVQEETPMAAQMTQLIAEQLAQRNQLGMGQEMLCTVTIGLVGSLLYVLTNGNNALVAQILRDIGLTVRSLVQAG